MAVLADRSHRLGQGEKVRDPLRSRLAGRQEGGSLKPYPWSFSALDKFVTCPKAFYETRVAKRIIEPEGEAAKWGNLVHDSIEKDLKGEAPLPTELATYKPYVEAIRSRPGTMLVEQKLALNRQLQPVKFFAKDVWVRGKADVVHLHDDTAYGMDHKTGKKKFTRQMMLMALLLFHQFPQIQRVRTAFFWLKTADITKEQFARSEVPTMWGAFVDDLEQYKEAFHTNTWQPRPSGLCHGWCPVTDCEYWKPKRLK